jgi:type II secretory pathway pseudopilin PulG
MKYSHKARGETIVEVLIATVLLVSVLASAFVALTRATQTNINVQNRVVAINLARESMESVRNIRDTNWLKYSGNRREKWLCLDSVGTPDTCEGGGAPTLMVDGYYQTNFSDTFQRYFLSIVPSVDELDIPNDSIGLASFRLYQEPLTGKFTYDDDGGDNPATPFYRQIELDVATDPVCGTECNEAKLKVTVRVGWVENDLSKNVILETHLFDFYQRDAY